MPPLIAAFDHSARQPSIFTNNSTVHTAVPAITKDLEHFLRQCDQNGKRALLVVDEAQNLTSRAVEELRMLSNFQTAEKSLLQTFLLGQPEFRRILLSPDFVPTSWARTAHSLAAWASSKSWPAMAFCAFSRA